MHQSESPCAPVCASLGHHIVTAHVVHCKHHGAVTFMVTAYTETAGELEADVYEYTVSGPFTLDLDLTVFLERFEELVTHLA